MKWRPARVAGLLAAGLLGAGCAARTPPPPVTSVPIPRDVPALLAQLRAGDTVTRLHAAFFLAHRHHSAAGVADALRTALEDASPAVREVAFYGLQPKADATAPSGGYEEGPRVLKQVKPVYPDDAFDKKIEGTVEVEFLIGRDGRVAFVYVLEGIPALNRAALQTVAQWTFTPARRGGQPVPTIGRAPVTFRIY